MEKLVIVGSGCAGLTASIYASRAQLSPCVIEGSLPGGLLTQTTEIENFPGFDAGISGLELMDRMKKQGARFGARFISCSVEAVVAGEDGEKILSLSDGTQLRARAVIFTTGSHPNLLHLPQEETLLGGKGLSVCATCDGFFYRNEVVCVVGGGDSACEEALYLSKLCQKVYLVHRRDALRASKIMCDRICANEKIEILWNSVPKAYAVDGEGFISGLTLENTQTHATSTCACKGIFLAIGWKPNTQNFRDFLPLNEQGYVQIAHRGVCTAVPGVFAAGDCVDSLYRQGCIAAGMGAQAALEAEAWLKDNE